MSISRTKRWQVLALWACGLLATTATGCLQTEIGGQTLPSAYYLRDDIQYFPAGQEFLLPNQVRALEEYKAQQQAFDEGYDDLP